MEAELRRLDAAHGLLAADAATMGRTQEEHAGYAGEVAEAKDEARRYAERARRDRWAMLAAFAVFLATAGYLAARRVLWAFMRVRLP